MSVTISPKTSRNGQKTWYYFEWGKAADQRKAARIFTYTKPKNQVEKNHNKESLTLLSVKHSQLIIEQQAIGTGLIPAHKYKQNFLDYYEEFVGNNKMVGNRHLQCSLSQFKAFVAKDFISPIDITENLCIRFRQFLLDNFEGDTPSNYFARFKKVIKAATKEGYYRANPIEDVKAKSGKSRPPKENLEVDEYLKLLQTPLLNQELREAFILCCYTGLRWCDVKPLDWTDIRGDQLRTRIIQAKTDQFLHITLHPLALMILKKRKNLLPAGTTSGKVFRLPTHDGANKELAIWCKSAGIEKHITWQCARLSFSILLQDENVDTATVALLLGHTSTKYVNSTYKRHRPKSQSDAISKLPQYSPQQLIIHNSEPIIKLTSYLEAYDF